MDLDLSAIYRVALCGNGIDSGMLFYYKLTPQRARAAKRIRMIPVNIVIGAAMRVDIQ